MVFREFKISSHLMPSLECFFRVKDLYGLRVESSTSIMNSPCVDQILVKIACYLPL